MNDHSRAQERQTRKQMRIQRRGLVKQMFDQGMSDYDIAAEFGISAVGVCIARKKYNKTGHVVALGLRSDIGVTTNSQCLDCAKNIGRRGSLRCQPCNGKLQKSTYKQHRQPFIDTLITWAEESGLVPTADQAQEILGMSRSRAADYVKHAFGPDPRPGYHRVGNQRPYKPAKDQHHASV